MNSLNRVAFAVAVAAFVGCTDPNAATNTNFSKAIDAYLLTQNTQAETCWGSGEYPNWGRTGDSELTKAGFLVEVGFSGNAMFGQMKYDLTPAGRKHFQPGKGFCVAGSPRVVRIANSSAPRSVGPYTMSRVHYETGIPNSPSWVRDNGLFAESDEANLILTANGWMHERLFR